MSRQIGENTEKHYWEKHNNIFMVKMIAIIWIAIAFIFIWLTYESYKQLKNFKKLKKEGKFTASFAALTEFGEHTFVHSNIQSIIDEFIKGFEGLMVGGIIASIISVISAFLSVF